MKRTSIICLGAVLLYSTVTRSVEPEKHKSSILMTKKLEYSQDLLKALLTEDSEQAERAVNLMKTFTRLEEMYGGANEGYQAQFKVFQKSVNELSKAVNDKNFDGGDRAYLKMVESCIQCHKLIRR